MWVVALSCDCGDRAAADTGGSIPGAHRCEPPLSAWLTVGSAMLSRRTTCLARGWSEPMMSGEPVVVHSHTLPIMSTQPVAVRRERSDRRCACPAQRTVVADTGSGPATCWPSAARPASGRHPTHRSTCSPRAPRTPIPPRSAAAVPPTARRPPHRDTRPARRDDPAVIDPAVRARTDAASTRRVPTATTAASRAGPPARTSAGTPAHPAPGRQDPPRDTARGRAAARRR